MKTIVFLFSILFLTACSESVSDSNSSNTVSTEMELTEELTPSESTEEVVIEEFGAVSSEPKRTDKLDEEIGSAERKIEDLENLKLKKTKLNELQSATVEKANAPQKAAEPEKPNHDKWDALLRANVSSSGKVNYSTMKAKSSDLEMYVTYLQSFVAQDEWSRNEKLAYWINLYNAATVRLIVQNYPVSSITDLSGGKPWDKNVVIIGDKNYSLNDIENKVIRPKFNDARIHFAVNCAAKSCPPLMNKAFTAENLNRQLEKQTVAFINSAENSIGDREIEISKIFDWYKIDFEKGDVIAFLNKYATSHINMDAETTYREYNWDLNK